MAGSGADPWRDLIKFALTAKGSRRTRERERASIARRTMHQTHSLALGPVAITYLRCGRKSLCGSATHTYSGRYYAVLWLRDVLWIAAAARDDHTCLAPAGQGSERSEKRAQRCTCTRPLMAFRNGGAIIIGGCLPGNCVHVKRNYPNNFILPSCTHPCSDFTLCFGVVTF